MAYFTSIKVTDVNGNVVELKDASDLLQSINKELKMIRLLLAKLADEDIVEEDVENNEEGE